MTSLKVTVDISHTYRGDLTVTLGHGGVTKTLVAKQGGSEDDIRATFDVTGYTDAALAGDWTLKVVDSAAIDTGTLESWSLEVGVN